MQCKYSYYGPKCVLSCPGGVCETCLGHGICNDGVTGDGKCVCFNDTKHGYWTGASCSRCVSGYYGLMCQSECRCTSHGTCNDGVFGDGKCSCDTGYEGSYCELCNDQIPNCINVLACPGPTNNPCYGHGNCTRKAGESSLIGECNCYQFFAGQNCSLQCPNNCSSHGTCSDGRDGSGKCTCEGQWALPDCRTCKYGYYGIGAGCRNECPGNATNPCNKHGTCLDDGTCGCDDYHSGPACEHTCPLSAVSHLACNGRGKCVGTGVCACYNDSTRGFWNGTTCDKCADAYGGAECQLECPTVDGRICNNSGVCKKDTAVCECTGNHCGRYCEALLVDQKCKSCEEEYLYGPGCKFTCTCNFNNGYCDNGTAGTGACTCNRGWSGQNCTAPCDGGVSNPCSGNGACDMKTGQCRCDGGYAGIACDKSCVLNCSGHGTCNDTREGDGTCTCTADYVWPSTGCNNYCNCSGHGYCAENLANVPKCTCSGNFSGPTCSECKAGLSGPENCSVVCKHGNTSGYECACEEGYAGLDCGTPCPKGQNGLYCSGNGKCHKTYERCECLNDWAGPSCSCQISKCNENGAKNKMCSSETGNCICTSRFSGDSCDSCVTGWYGWACDTACECNNRGPCDQLDGTCSCYQDKTHGYYQGAKCEVCLEGYMGSNCDQKSSPVTVIPSLVFRGSAKVATEYATIDDDETMLYVGGATNAAFNYSSLTLQVVSGGVHPFLGTVQNLFRYKGKFTAMPNASNFWNLSAPLIPITYTLNKFLYILHQNSSATSDVRLYVSDAYFEGMVLAVPNMLSADTSYETKLQFSVFIRTAPTPTICMIPTAEDTLYQIFCKGLDLNPPYTSISKPFVSMLAMIDSTYYTGSIVSVTQSSVSSTCMLYVYDWQANILENAIDIATEVARFDGENCIGVDCMYELGDLLLLGLRSSRYSFVAVYNMTSHSIIQMARVLSTYVQCTGISYDDTSEMGLAMFKSNLFKFALKRNSANQSVVEGVTAYGYQTIGSQDIFSFEFSKSRQVAFAPAAAATGVEVMRFLLLELESVTPTVADRSGTTIVTLKGKGFRNVSTAVCRFDTTVTPATYLSPTTASCVAPKIVSSEACLAQALSISMNGGSYTPSLSLQRPVEPSLTGATPSRALCRTVVEVTISGNGMLQCLSAACYFVDPQKNETIATAATFAAGSLTYSCMSPNKSTASSPNSFVTLAMDGQHAAAFQLPFVVVGDIVGIIVEPLSMASRTAAAVLFPAPSVFTVDVAGNKALDFDSAERNVTATFDASVKWFAQMHLGWANLSNMVLHKPRLGKTTVQIVASTIVGDTVTLWNTSMTITITPGEIAAMQVENPTAVDSVIPGLRITPTQISALDVAGNNVDDATGRQVSVWMLEYNESRGVNFQSNNSAQLSDIVFDAGGFATMEQAILYPRFGHKFVFFFRLTNTPSINVTTKTFLAQCLEVQFQVLEETSCRDCPSTQATCNGSDILLAKPEFWRASRSSLNFYSCPIKHTCGGGTEYGGCVDHHDGPMCSLCEEGYEQDFQYQCGQCPGTAGSIAILAIVLTIFVALATIYTMTTAQNWRATNSRAGHSLTTLQLLVLYLQTLSLMEYARVAWPTRIRNILSLVGTFVDLRMNSIQSIMCLFRSWDLDAKHLMLLYSGFTIVVAVLIAFVSYVAFALFPNVLQSTDAKVAKQKLLDDRRQYGSLAQKTEKGGKVYFKEHRRKALLFLSTQIVIFFLFQSGAYNTFRMFRCASLQLGDGQTKSYLTTDMSVDCTTDEYKTLRGVAILLGSIYAIIIPVGTLLLIAFCRIRYHEDFYKLYMSFLTMGLKEDVWFWGGIVMIRKSLTTLVLAFGEYPLDAYLFLWVMSIYLALQWYFKPFQDSMHNFIDIMGTMSIWVTGNLSLLYGSDIGTTVYESTTWACIALLVVMFVVFMWFMVRVWVIVSIQRARAARLFVDDTPVAETPMDILHRLEREEQEMQLQRDAATVANKTQENKPRLIIPHFTPSVRLVDELDDAAPAFEQRDMTSNDRSNVDDATPPARQPIYTYVPRGYIPPPPDQLALEADIDAYLGNVARSSDSASIASEPPPRVVRPAIITQRMRAAGLLDDNDDVLAGDIFARPACSSPQAVAAADAQTPSPTQKASQLAQPTFDDI